MQTDDKTINHLNLQRLVASGAQVGVEVVGGTGGWGEVIIYGRASQTLAGYLKELGIVEYRVNAAAAVELVQEFEAKAEYAGGDRGFTSLAASTARARSSCGRIR